MKHLIKKNIFTNINCNIKFNENLSKYTSFKIGGPGDIVIFPETTNDIKKIISINSSSEIPLTILGSGTNTLIKDSGISGVVMILSKWEMINKNIRKKGKSRIIKISSGVNLKKVCSFAIKKGLSGLNFSIGIPGTIGGAIITNANTKKGSFEKILYSLTIINKYGIIKKIKQPKIGFLLKNWGKIKKNCIILECELSLIKKDPDVLKKQARYFMSKRKRTQPIKKKSAGCFFKNPKSGFSAGELIDKAGMKGEKIGDAKVSTKHANFIINNGKATCYDVLKLANSIRKSVYNKFNITLNKEVHIVGNKEFS